LLLHWSHIEADLEFQEFHIPLGVVQHCSLEEVVEDSGVVDGLFWLKDHCYSHMMDCQGTNMDPEAELFLEIVIGFRRLRVGVTPEEAPVVGNYPRNLPDHSSKVAMRRILRDRKSTPFSSRLQQNVSN